jgi:hypothetical protein
VPKAQGLNTIIKKIKGPLTASQKRYQKTSATRRTSLEPFLVEIGVADTTPALSCDGSFSSAIH